MPVYAIDIAPPGADGRVFDSFLLSMLLVISFVVIITLTVYMLYYRRRYHEMREGLVRYINIYIQLKDYVPADKRPVVSNLSVPVIPDEFIKIIQKMLKRMLILPLFALLAMPLAAQDGEVTQTDSVYEFRFVPQKDMFFIPYGKNRAEMERLSSLVIRYKETIMSGQMPLFVDGYCHSMSGEAENKAVARTRANRVKSELILHQGLTEKCFVTHSHAGEGEWVTVRAIARHHTEIPAGAPMESKFEADDKASAMEKAEATEKVAVTVTAAPTEKVTAAEETEELNSGVENLSGTGIAEKGIYTLALRANLLRWATLTPDLGVEWRIDRRWSVLLNGSWTSWSWSDKDRRYALWKVSPEVRYYIGKEKRGFLGAMYHRGEFNHKLGETGKQGDDQGGGITGGYVLSLNRALSLDFHAGIGYTHAEYDKYKVTDHVRVRQGSDSKDYWGVNQLGVTLVWKFNQ